MANNGVTQIVKKNHKLEIFLKRNLDVDTYEKIRAYDPCVVCSEKEDKAFKFAILSDEWMYLTENPPKKIYETVHMKDIVSIDLLNDYPSFLQGEERENTQHIVIRYRTDGSDSKQPKSARQEKKDKNSGGDTDRSTSPGLPITPRSARNPIIIPYGRKSFSARETKEYKLQTAKQLLAESRLCQTTRESSTNDLHGFMPEGSSKRVQFGSLTAHSHSSSPRELTAQSTTSPRSVSPILKRSSSPLRSDSPGPIHESSASKSSRKKGKKAKKSSGSSDSDSVGSRPLPSPRSTESKLTPRIKGELKLDLSRLATSEDEDDDLFNDGSDNSLMDSTHSNSSKGVAVIDTGSSRGGLCGGKQTKMSTASLTSTSRSLHDLRDEEEFVITLRDGTFLSLDYLAPQISVTSADSTSGDEDGNCLSTVLYGRDAVLHLYVISKTSKILMLTKSAWYNYILRGTLEEDPAFVIRTTVIAPKSAQPTSEKLELLFRQLKTELQYTTNSMVDIFYHIHELKVAADRNFALRKVFWKTPDVFRFMVNQLKKYVPMSEDRFKNLTGDEATKTQRADELEFLNLLLETLSLLFRETEIVPTRIHMMKAEGGALTQALVAVLMAMPETPQRGGTQAGGTQMVHNLYTSSRDGTAGQTEHDAEISRLVREYKNTATTILFELLVIGEQGAWVDKETSLLNVSWVIQEMHKSNNVDALVEHLISEAMSLISPRRRDRVTPPEALLLYHQFHILRNLIDFNNQVISFIQNNFYEEFKYYVQGPVLQRKLPANYLLRPYIFDLMENVIGKVLQKNVQLSEIQS